jgi:hypothetical protein
VAHPGDHGGFGPLLDRDALCPGYRAAADRRGVVGDGPCQPLGEAGVVWMESQERQDRTVEVLDVLGLGLVTAASLGCFALHMSRSRSLGVEFSTDAVSDTRR